MEPWTLERVVAELQQLAAGGEVITYAALRANGPGPLVTAAERQAGSLAKAIALAGLTYGSSAQLGVEILDAASWGPSRRKALSGRRTIDPYACSS